MQGHDGPEDLKLLVRVLRELREWDQAEMAAAAGVDVSSISHYETGRTVPPRRTLERLAAAVGLQMSFVETCLLPMLSTARAVTAPFAAESSGDLEEHAVELGRALASRRPLDLSRRSSRARRGGPAIVGARRSPLAGMTGSRPPISGNA